MTNREKSQTKKCLIVNADDFGSSPAVNTAIEQSSLHGIVTSTTVMVNLPAAAGVTVLKSNCPTLGIGLHLNLTTGRPLCSPQQVRSLVDNEGMFLKPSLFERRLWSGQIRYQHLKLEIAAQIAELQQMIGAISHIDSHKHIHRYPPVLLALLEASRPLGIHKVRTNSRYYVGSTSQDSSSGRLSFKHYKQYPLSAVAIGLKWIQRWLIGAYRFVAPDFLVTPVPQIRVGSQIGSAAEAWKLVCSRLPAGSFETNFHPGGVPGEEALLCHPTLQEGLGDVQLANYWNL